MFSITLIICHTIMICRGIKNGIEDFDYIVAILAMVDAVLTLTVLVIFAMAYS